MKCYHENFVSIFNPDNPHGCAYCPDCGKRPLSVEECAYSIVKPGWDNLSKAIAKDLLDTCPEPNCDYCKQLRREYPDIY